MNVVELFSGRNGEAYEPLLATLDDLHALVARSMAVGDGEQLLADVEMATVLTLSRVRVGCSD